VLVALFSIVGEVELGFLYVVVIGNTYLLGLQVWKILKAREGPVSQM
jgi:hypothetical protein